MSVLKIKTGNDQWFSIPAGGVGVPSGGASGKVLKKNSSIDYDTSWGSVDVIEVGSSAPTDTDIDLWLDTSAQGNSSVSSVDGKTGTVSVLPSGGTAGQFLKKSSATDYAVTWEDIIPITTWSPELSATVLDLQTYATNNPGKMFVWNTYGNSASYVPSSETATWVFTLYCPVQNNTGYVFLEAYNTYTGNVYRAGSTVSLMGSSGWAKFSPVPHQASITTSTTWTTNADDWTQTVTVSGAYVMSTSRIDLRPNTTVLNQMLSDGCAALYVENNSGTLTLHAIGAALSAAVTLPVLVSEVS